MDLPLPREAVGDAGGVAQQVVNRHLPLSRDQIQLRLAVVALGLNADLGLRESRDVLRDRLLQRQLSLLHQHQGRHRGDRLRHRVDAKQRVWRHRRLGRYVANAEALEVDRPAAPLHQHDDTRDVAGCNLGLEELGDVAELGPREARLILRVTLTDGFSGGRQRCQQRRKHRHHKVAELHCCCPLKADRLHHARTRSAGSPQPQLGRKGTEPKGRLDSQQHVAVMLRGVIGKTTEDQPLDRRS
jgi:hypothetical protein